MVRGGSTQEGRQQLQLPPEMESKGSLPFLLHLEHLVATNYLETEQEKRRAAASFHFRTAKRPEKMGKIGLRLCSQHCGAWHACSTVTRLLEGAHSLCWRPGGWKYYQKAYLHTAVVSCSSLMLWREACIKSECWAESPWWVAEAMS